MAADLSQEFALGFNAAKHGMDRCPYYATSPAADAYHAGRAIFALGELQMQNVVKATAGRGYRINVWSDRGQFVALVDWNAPGDGPPAVTVTPPAGDRQLLELRAKAPLRSKGKPVEDAGFLPLFVAANEPSLF